MPGVGINFPELRSFPPLYSWSGKILAFLPGWGLTVCLSHIWALEFLNCIFFLGLTPLSAFYHILYGRFRWWFAVHSLSFWASWWCWSCSRSGTACHQGRTSAKWVLFAFCWSHFLAPAFPILKSKVKLILVCTWRFPTQWSVFLVRHLYPLFHALKRWFCFCIPWSPVRF